MSEQVTEGDNETSLAPPPENSDESGFAEKQRAHQKELEEFLTQFEATAPIEEKLQLAIAFMRRSLAHSGTPYFKGFWEARQICLPLFKEAIAAPTRAQLWKDYRELCSESQRLKQLLEEESAFAIEQIELAIQALETDVATMADKLALLPDVAFTASSVVLEPHYEQFQAIQKELQLLNAHAGRINSLRKELIRTEMRIRQKNKFFRRLSAIGDEIFPKRKDLIKAISTLFLEDVQQFVNDNFEQEQLRQPLFFYRDEIKALQGIAKVLTLNTHAFTYTRNQLSGCWDRVKEIEKERKKVRAEQKVTFQQNVTQILQQIETLSTDYASGQLTVAAAQKAIDAVFDTMSQLEIGRDEKRHIREKLTEAKQPIIAKIREEEQQRVDKEQAVEREKREKANAVKEAIQQLLKEAETLTAEEITTRREALFEQIQTAPLTKTEKQSLERGLKPLKDLIAEKKERALLSLSEQDLEVFDQLHQVLKQRKERRKEIKAQYEDLRKAAGSSGFSFEKALAYDEQVKAERERLEKIDEAIREIEMKIESIES